MEKEVSYCPQTFDSWSCWNETPAGETAYAPCPWFVPGFEPSKFAYKECLEDGSWFKDSLTNQTWTNYTTCVNIEALLVSNYELKTLWVILRKVLPNVSVVSEVGNTVSVFVLILSLLIYCQFPSLSSPRATIHKHFLASFTIHNSLWLVWYRTVIKVITVDELNEVSTSTYSTSATRSLEGNRNYSKWFYIFGWLGPLIPLGLYAIIRATDADPNETKDCWIQDSKWSLLISVPECICLLACLVIVINIVRVQVMKFRFELSITESVASDRSIRKAALTTLILISLLGLEYVILPFKPDKKSNESEAATYNYVEELTTSLQGLAVSLILCFCKRQVRAIIKRYVCRTKRLQTWFMRTFMTNAKSGETRQNTRSTTMNLVSQNAQ
ncbi:Calcitonin-like peptide type 1 receptor [Orchesella cincta]|uniref:Calcitonin-like peptide type 1 receptor n=1 Tax=Orchesella cincta TaxID=48709 RepID=A0A1D2MBQ2_ORCCI|nr:Calcitonin-like peptide type 1 receptor [Orchesella cincta]